MNYVVAAKRAMHCGINRYYDPSTGQFVSVDPLVGLTGQPYAYARNDPINLDDPLGLCNQPKLPSRFILIGADVNTGSGIVAYVGNAAIVVIAAICAVFPYIWFCLFPNQFSDTDAIPEPPGIEKIMKPKPQSSNNDVSPNPVEKCEQLFAGYPDLIQDCIENQADESNPGNQIGDEP